MARERKRATGEVFQLEMTPMIDVVFQLLIFFIVTLKQEDILSHLDVIRPAPDQAPPKPPEEDVKLLTVLVYKDGFVLQGRKVDLKELDRQFSKLATFNSKVSIVIKCTNDSPHLYLMQFLDICAKNKLTNLALFSM
jgi:biopolymer transport protein ExbD